MKNVVRCFLQLMEEHLILEEYIFVHFKTFTEMPE